MKEKLCCLGILIFLFLPEVSFAQCDCDFIISLSGSEWQFDGVEHNVKPGDKICFTGGTRTAILFKNIHGTATQPVLITNMCNSSVIIDAPSHYGNAIQVDNCSYIRLSGAGNPGKEHGIEIKGAQMGVNFQAGSTNFEADHLNVHDTGCVGIVAKTDPTCDSKTWRGNFSMRNTSFHDNIVSNTGCEGFYIGNSHYETGVTKTCNGVSLQIKEHDVVNTKVYNNKVQNTANDGIQIGGAISGCEVYQNVVSNFGTANSFGHVNGFQAGSGTTQAKVFNNTITNGKGYCFWDSGGGGTYYNNIAANGLLGGFSFQDVSGTYAPTGFIASNNTIVNCAGLGIIMYSENPNTSRFVNNIIVSGLVGYAYIKFNSSIAQSKVVVSNNLNISSVSSAKFVNPSVHDYHLLSSSPAIDAGIDMRSYGVTNDRENNTRPQGVAFDIGAYEFQSGSSNAPVANAGTDKIITLPANSVTLSGSATDSDGTISGYSWTKVSGGEATLTNTNTATLKVSGMVAGTYSFRLTATDNTGKKASDDVTVTVKSNSPPKSKAGSDKKINLPNNTAVFYGSGTDGDGTITGFMWTKVSGGTASLTNGNTSTLTASGLSAGIYIFRLTVTDNNGATASDDVKLTVNTPPVASAGTDKNLLLPANTITLSGNGSDSDGVIVGYLWLKISGQAVTLTNATTSTVTISGLVAGTYKFRLRVKDNCGATDTDDVIVTISGNPTAKIASAEVVLDEPEENVFEEDFSFMNKTYPSGYDYTIAIFNKNRERIFHGEWSNDIYDEIINAGELYLYEVRRDNRQIDSGKFIRMAD